VGWDVIPSDKLSLVMPQKVTLHLLEILEGLQFLTCVHVEESHSEVTLVCDPTSCP
jgi:hypothetical protein